MEIVLASNNKKKIAELETLLASASSKIGKVKSLREIGWTEEIEENGSTFEENSVIKASVPAKLGYLGIADDSGLAVDYLNGAPGIYSARYSGGGDPENRAKLLAALEGVPEEQRTARFVCTASLVLPENCPLTIPEAWRIPEALAEKAGIPASRVMVVRGECEGVITTEEQGDGGFGYDPLFRYPAFDVTFAQISQEKKNTVSHRGKAMREFIRRLTAILEG